MSNLMVIDMGALPIAYDDELAQELTKDLTAGLSGSFKRAPRLSMGNSGDWELVTPEGEAIDLGRSVNIVIVDQRKVNSRIHYAKSFDKQKEEGVSRKLVGFELLEKGVPRHDYPVVDAEGNVIGKVTSGTSSPMKKIGLGLAYVKTEFSKPESAIFIQIRNKNIPAKVVKTPFV